MGFCLLFALSALVVDGVVSESSGWISVSATKGDSVHLNTDVIKQERDKMLWYYEDTLIALINGEPSKSCVYEGKGGKFRDALKVDYQTGSLIINNSRPEHSGRFEANFIKSKGSGTIISLNRNSKCNSTKVIWKKSNIGVTIKTFNVSVSATSSGLEKKNKEVGDATKEQDFEKNSLLSSALIVGSCVVFLSVLVSVFVVVYRRHKSSINETDKSKLQHLMTV